MKSRKIEKVIRRRIHQIRSDGPDLGLVNSSQLTLTKLSSSLLKRGIAKHYNVSVNYLPGGQALPNNWYKVRRRRGRKNHSFRQSRAYARLVEEWASGVLYVRIPKGNNFPKGSRYERVIKDHYTVDFESSTNKTGLARFLAGLSCRHPHFVINFGIFTFREFMSKIPTTAKNILRNVPKRLCNINDYQTQSDISPRCKNPRYCSAVLKYKYLELGSRNFIKATFPENLERWKIRLSHRLSYDSRGNPVLLGTWQTPRHCLTKVKKCSIKYFDVNLDNIDNGNRRDVQYLYTEKRDEIPILDCIL